MASGIDCMDSCVDLFDSILFFVQLSFGIQYIASKFGISPEQVRDVKKLVGRSRRKIYKEIRDNVC